jgi:hypothetical protein
MTAFTSQWSKSYFLNDLTLNRFIYVAVFDVKKCHLNYQSYLLIIKNFNI